MTFTDPILGYSEPHRYWTTANIGEAVPDVMTPLCWSLWGSGNQLGSMCAWASFGLFDPADTTVRPDRTSRRQRRRPPARRDHTEPAGPRARRLGHRPRHRR